MKPRLFLRSTTLTAFLLYFFYATVLSQQPAHFDPRPLRLEWDLVRNFTPDNPKFTAALTILNTTNTSIPADGWKLYFSLRYHGYTLTSYNPLLEIQHLSGDL